MFTQQINETIQSSIQLKRHKLTLASVLCLFVCACALAALCPGLAQAEVRKSDIILGQSVEARGLPASSCPNISSEYALVVDPDGKVYFERGAVTPARIASMTKIMTAIVALENSNPSDIVTVDHEAATVGESSAALREGDTMTMDTALLALMVPSGNDAAVAIAKTVGKSMNPDTADPEQVFVDAMNDKAQELGCKDTYYENPHGLDINQFDGDLQSTAADMGRIVCYAMQNEQFRDIVSHGDTSISVTSADGNTREIMLESTDELIGVYDGIAGVKTGYTESAGYCFAGAVIRDEGEYYSVIMNAPSSDQRFTDTATLMDWVYGHHVNYPLAISDETTTMATANGIVEVPVVAHVAHQGWIDVTIPATLSNPDQCVTVFDLSGNITQSVEFYPVTNDVHTGDIIGSITYTQRSVEIARMDIVATQDVLAPSLFEGIKIWWDRLFRGFSGEPKVAESVLINQTPLLIDKSND